MGSKIVKSAAVALAATGLALGALASPAIAGEGHWSIGKGIQCRIVSGVVVCSHRRP